MDYQGLQIISGLFCQSLLWDRRDSIFYFCACLISFGYLCLDIQHLIKLVAVYYCPMPQPQRSPSESSINSVSTVRNRITRKTENSFEKRLISRQKSRSHKFGNSSFQQYYQNQMKSKGHLTVHQPNVKVYGNRENPQNSKYLKSIKVSEQPKVPQLIDRARKRLPTPVKSRKQLQKYEEETKNSDDEDKRLENQMMMLNLQESLKTCQRKRDEAVSQKQFFRSELSKVKTESDQLHQENKALVQENRALEEKIKVLEKCIQESESNLATATNHLKKLKQQIKDARIQELQRENLAMLEQIKCLKHTISMLEEDNKNLEQSKRSAQQQAEFYYNMKKEADYSEKSQQQRQNYLFDQINKLKQQLSLCKDQRQYELQHILSEKEQMIYGLEVEIEKQRLMRHQLEYKSKLQSQKLIKKYEAEIKGIRVKYSKIIADNKQKKISPAHRPSLLSRNSSRQDKDHEIDFMLSPDPFN